MAKKVRGRPKRNGLIVSSQQSGGSSNAASKKLDSQSLIVFPPKLTFISPQNTLIKQNAQSPPTSNITSSKLPIISSLQQQQQQQSTSSSAATASSLFQSLAPKTTTSSSSSSSSSKPPSSSPSNIIISSSSSQTITPTSPESVYSLKDMVKNISSLKVPDMSGTVLYNDFWRHLLCLTQNARLSDSLTTYISSCLQEIFTKKDFKQQADLLAALVDTELFLQESVPTVDQCVIRPLAITGPVSALVGQYWRRKIVKQNK
ncbi:MAG: hypothetical protein EZS28_031165, partial [Streblomastix strix]